MTDSETEPPIRVLLLFKNRLLREALSRLCRKREDLLLVKAMDYSDSVASCLVDDPPYEVLVLDFLDRRFLTSLSALRHQQSNEFKPILIDMQDDAQEFLAAVRAGVLGYLLKNASGSEVIAAIGAIHKHEAVCPSHLCAHLFQQYARGSCVAEVWTAQPSHELTLRQRQLMNLVAKGLTNKEIAAQLNLSEFTVRNHIHRILKQVEVSSRQEAVRVVRAQGLTVPQ